MGWFGFGSGVPLLLRKIKINTKALLFNEDLTPNEEGGMAFPYIYMEPRLQPMVLWLCVAYGPFKRPYFYTMAPPRKISRLHHSQEHVHIKFKNHILKTTYTTHPFLPEPPSPLFQLTFT